MEGRLELLSLGANDAEGISEGTSLGSEDG